MRLTHKVNNYFAQYIHVRDGELVVCIGVANKSARKFYQEGEVFRCVGGHLYPLVERNYPTEQSFGGYDGYWAIHQSELKTYEDML